MRLMRKKMRQAPEEGTESSIWPQVSAWWSEFQTGGSSAFFSPRLAERVWVANRCIQLNSQQIASMPLRFGSNAPGGGFEPAWVSNPDPAFFPNGIGDALAAAVESLYGWGYTLLQVTSTYANGFPQAWTVLDQERVRITLERGRRAYSISGTPLDPQTIVQIDRDPSSRRIHGTSALRAYSSQSWSLIASSELSQSVMQGGVPTSVIKSARKLTEAQARAVQSQWVEAVARRGGAPAVLPPELDFETLSFSPKDLMLLEGQEFTARVVASAFGVPAFMLNLPMAGALIYQNPQALGEFWWRFELRPTAKRIADALTAQMLPRGNWVTFDATDTFAPIAGSATESDDSQVANASPAQQPLRQLRPIEEVTA